MTSKTKQFFENQFNRYIVNKVNHYQKKYGFDMQNGSTHNNEADAFKHTFASALVSIEESSTAAFGGGWYHEITNKNNNWDELRMDTNNNKVGREIANKMRHTKISLGHIYE